jgi:hypothetical protein
MSDGIKLGTDVGLLLGTVVGASEGALDGAVVLHLVLKSSCGVQARPAAQSLSVPHVPPSAKAGHDPPQSTSVSSLS